MKCWSQSNIICLHPSRCTQIFRFESNPSLRWLVDILRNWSSTQATILWPQRNRGFVCLCIWSNRFCGVLGVETTVTRISHWCLCSKGWIWSQGFQLLGWKWTLSTLPQIIWSLYGYLRPVLATETLVEKQTPIPQHPDDPCVLGRGSGITCPLPPQSTPSVWILNPSWCAKFGGISASLRVVIPFQWPKWLRISSVVFRKLSLAVDAAAAKHWYHDWRLVCGIVFADQSTMSWLYAASAIFYRRIRATLYLSLIYLDCTEIERPSDWWHSRTSGRTNICECGAFPRRRIKFHSVLGQSFFGFTE